MDIRLIRNEADYDATLQEIDRLMGISVTQEADFLRFS